MKNYIIAARSKEEVSGIAMGLGITSFQSQFWGKRADLTVDENTIVIIPNTWMELSYDVTSKCNKVIPLFLPNTNGMEPQEVAEITERKASEFHRTVERQAKPSIPLTDGIVKMLIPQELHPALDAMSGETKASFVLDQIKAMTDAIPLPKEDTAPAEDTAEKVVEEEEIEVNF